MTSNGDLSKEKSIAADSANKTIIKGAMFFFNNPMFTFLLLILPSALSTRLVFRSVNYNNLAKHFVVNIYCFCFIAFATGILSAFFNQEEYLMYYLQQLEDSKKNIKTDILWKFEFYNYFYFIMPILYYLYAFKKIFNLSWISSIFKTVISLVVSGAIIFFSAVLLVITIMLL